MKVAFFDRDGTIIEDYPDSQWRSIKNPVIIDGAIDILREVINKGYKVIIITNQYIINEGYITLDQYHSIKNQMISELRKHHIELFDIFHCPHRKNEGCPCMKPKDGMVRQAIEKYPEIKLANSFVIGDSTVDIELAIGLEMNGFGIGTGADYKKKSIIQLNSIKELIYYI